MDTQPTEKQIKEVEDMKNYLDKLDSTRDNIITMLKGSSYDYCQTVLRAVDRKIKKDLILTDNLT